MLPEDAGWARFSLCDLIKRLNDFSWPVGVCVCLCGFSERSEMPSPESFLSKGCT